MKLTGYPTTLPFSIIGEPILVDAAVMRSSERTAVLPDGLGEGEAEELTAGLADTEGEALEFTAGVMLGVALGLLVVPTVGVTEGICPTGVCDCPEVFDVDVAVEVAV